MTRILIIYVERHIPHSLQELKLVTSYRANKFLKTNKSRNPIIKTLVIQIAKYPDCFEKQIWLDIIL